MADILPTCHIVSHYISLLSTRLPLSSSTCQPIYTNQDWILDMSRVCLYRRRWKSTAPPAARSSVTRLKWRYGPNISTHTYTSENPPRGRNGASERATHSPNRPRDVQLERKELILWRAEGGGRLLGVKPGVEMGQGKVREEEVMRG